VGQLGLVLVVQAVLKSVVLTWLGVRLGLALSSNAIVPATCGVAIDVPLMYA
jgi:hypothetical protein